MLFSAQIQTIAPYWLLWRKLTLSQPKPAHLEKKIHSKLLRICRGKWIGFHCQNNVVSWKWHRCIRHIYSYLRGVSSCCKLITTTDYTMMSIHFNANFNTSALNVFLLCISYSKGKPSGNMQYSGTEVKKIELIFV